VPRIQILPATIALFLMACGGADHTIDRIFDPCMPLPLSTDSTADADRACIEEAIGLWNALAQTQLTLVDDASGLVSIALSEGLPAQLGVYDDEHGVVLVNQALDPGRSRTITIAHELGHVMGLEHVKDSERRSVMVSGNTDTPPGDADRASLNALWGECSSNE
jgi:hypothetical protein